MPKIVRFHALGGPEVLKFEDVPVPSPGPGEVRLKVRAIGLNRAESMFYHGYYLYEAKLPATLGYEASGTVEAVGPDVDKSWIGKAVSTIPAFSLNEYGVLGEEVLVPLSAIAEYPANLSPEEATAIWMQYITAYGALVGTAHIQKGDHVLIPAASSSVGLAAIQIAKAEDAISIATTRRSNKKAELAALGADHVIATEEEDLVTRVLEITGGKGARIIFDPVAGPGVEKLLEAIRYEGVLIVYGNLSLEATPLPLVTGMLKAVTIHAYTLMQFTRNPERLPVAIKYIYDRLKDGRFQPKIAKTFPFTQTTEAYRYLESNTQVGKVVITIP